MYVCGSAVSSRDHIVITSPLRAAIFDPLSHYDVGPPIFLCHLCLDLDREKRNVNLDDPVVDKIWKVTVECYIIRHGGAVVRTSAS